MVISKYSTPIAVKVAIDRRLRISMPRCFQISAPFILFEASGGEEPWVGICEVGALAEVSKHGGDIQVLAQYWSQRPALPANVCGFTPGTALWLVTVDSWLEVWLETRWQTNMDKALVSLD